MVKMNKMVRKLELDLKLLKKCKEENLFPKFVKFKLSNPRLGDDVKINDCYLNILNAEIKFKKRQLSRRHRIYNRLRCNFQDYVTVLEYARCIRIMDGIVREEVEKWSKTHSTKLKDLRDAQGIDNTIIRLDPVKNLSSHMLSSVEHEALCNALHHAYPFTNIDQIQLISNMEYFYARLLGVKTSFYHWEENRLMN
ncbi:unnamed protein product [Didymodactylos carnosus]|uniref:Uncharacterized protein n=1 Tax=Didymodactylos carnosus TaxID=1234261 RepID=A0A815ZU27_9BILA|nr:unnamed protein product [Didymodactylos carnosus]CAF1586556.1 unnamed protein product [Didymodactylos carnosus]CAF4386788.1 unnamed protein product [Didymodactylos carnosus]CAF4456394.1 unnamed protein product [Didymodactylos carnosus]